MSETTTTTTMAKELARFTLTRNEIKAMLTLVSHDESRFVLTGVGIEIRPEAVTLMATDGRKLGALRCPPPEFIAGEWLDLVAPFKMALAIPLGRLPIIVTVLEGQFGQKRLRYRDYKYVTEEDSIAGNFPAWRHNVTPREDAERDAKPVRFSVNSEYITHFEKASRLLCPKNAGVVIVPHGDSGGAFSVLLPGEDRFYGLVIPMRDSNRRERVVPDWASNKPKAHVVNDASGKPACVVTPAPAAPAAPVSDTQPATAPVEAPKAEVAA